MTILNSIKHKEILVTVCCLKSDKLYFVNIFSANKVAVLGSVDWLQNMCQIVLLKLSGQPRATNTFLEGCMFDSPALRNHHSLWQEETKKISDRL
jgi:hypothetical protein